MVSVAAASAVVVVGDDLYGVQLTNVYVNSERANSCCLEGRLVCRLF